MNNYIKGVEHILEEEILKDNSYSFFDELNNLSQIKVALRNYNRKEDNATTVFIRALASNNEIEDVYKFQKLANNLAESNSKLALYLIASNPNVSEETRINIAQKENVSDVVLTKLAENSQNIHLLESLVDSNNEYIKLTVLNNPTFGVSVKTYEYFKACIESFSLNYLEQLKYVPESLKEDFEYFKKLRKLEDEMRTIANKFDMFMALDDESIGEETFQEYYAIKRELDELKSQRTQMKK